MSNEKGRVYLVGAGPGDPGLITVRGRRLTRRADVILHDRLVPRTLLDSCRTEALLVDVGKVPGRVASIQDEINTLLIEHARAGRIVVRLKGGDPFVFGRGYEELEACRAADVPCTVVPGISSALAAPTSVDVPLTRRLLERSFAVITGNTEDDTLPDHDYAALAKIDTLCVLMGRQNLAALADRLIAAGRSPETPACVIADATWSTARTVAGTLATIATRADNAGLKPPVVTVIGATASLARPPSQPTRSAITSPLVGRRLILTQAQRCGSELARRLRQAGATVIDVPLIKITYPETTPPVDEALRRVRQFDWIILTSVHGVRGFWRRMDALQLDARALSGVQIAAVGPGTARELAPRGITADFVPLVHQGTALVKEWTEVAGRSGQKVLLPQGSAALPTVREGLLAAGADVTQVVVYETHATEPSAMIRDRLQQEADALLFCSPSAVQNYARLGLNGRAKAVACIGPTTANAARRAGMQVDIEPDAPGGAGLAAALEAFFTRSKETK